MPIHDWTRVGAGTWHAFHLSWISEIRLGLNDGRLPPSYYAQAEQIAGPTGPDVLALQVPEGPGEAERPTSGGLAVATAPPRAKLVAEAELEDYVSKRRTLVIRHASGDRIVALIEIVSPGNKSGQFGLRSFVEKAVEAVYQGYHLLIVDLFPPTPSDPQGIPGAVWGELTGTAVGLPAEGPLTLAAVMSGPVTRLYLEGTAVGRSLVEMPLFLEPDYYVDVPLEETYTAAYRGVRWRWKRILEG
jgi:hypothetical protein